LLPVIMLIASVASADIVRNAGDTKPLKDETQALGAGR
jgi:hypothetical protein